MDTHTQSLVLKKIQYKSVQYLTLSPTRATLNKRIHQVAGMIDIIKLMPGCADMIEPLQQHHESLKAKVKAWPV